MRYECHRPLRGQVGEALQDGCRRHAQFVGGVLINSGMWFIEFQRVDTEDTLESLSQAVRIDDRPEHVRRAVGQNGEPAVCEAPECILHFGKGFKAKVGIEERIALLFCARKLKRAAGKHEVRRRLIRGQEHHVHIREVPGCQGERAMKR